MTSGPIFPGLDQGPAGLAGPAGLDPGQQGQQGQFLVKRSNRRKKAGPKKSAVLMKNDTSWHVVQKPGQDSNSKMPKNPRGGGIF